MTISYKLRWSWKKLGPCFIKHIWMKSILIFSNFAITSFFEILLTLFLWKSWSVLSHFLILTNTSWSELKLPKIESHHLFNNMCCNKYIYYSWIGPGTILQHTSRLNSLNYCSRSLTKWETHVITRFNIHLIFSKQDSDQEY